jgi:hypothetical protein
MFSLTPNASFRLSPSAVAWYSYLNCDYYLCYWATPQSVRTAGAVPENQFDHRPLMQAALESGIAWEKEGVGQFPENQGSITSASEPPNERRFTAPATIDRLRSELTGRLICQATLRPRMSLYHAFGLDPDHVAFGDCHPDSIEAGIAHALIQGADLMDDPTLPTALEFMLNVLPPPAAARRAKKADAFLGGAASDFEALEKLRQLAFGEKVPKPVQKELDFEPAAVVEGEDGEEADE